MESALIYLNNVDDFFLRFDLQYFVTKKNMKYINIYF